MTLTLAAALGAGAACSTAAAETSNGPSRAVAALRITALGDSLTSGYGLKPDEAYPRLLEAALRDAGLPASVLNHGLSGDTTSGGVRRLQAALDTDPHILIVALGANDGLRGVPVAQVRANLDTIIEAAQLRGVRVLLCGMEALPLYGWQYTIDFHHVFPDLAAKHGVPLVPFLLTGVVGNQGMLLPDGAHPNAAGAKLMAANILPYLRGLAEAVASR